VLDKAGKMLAFSGSTSTPSGTCASTLFEGGKNIRQVSAWLGHTDPVVTLRTYVHLMDSGLGAVDFPDAAVRAVPTLDSVVSEPRGPAQRGHVSA
jgi:hypothetical protein